MKFIPAIQFFSNYSKGTQILNANPTHIDLCTKPTLSLALLTSITILNIYMCVCVCVCKDYMKRVLCLVW
jgi:hypothetical protein